MSRESAEGRKVSESEAEERAQFTLAMRTRGIDDIGLLRALERAPRALFMPQRFADISGRDMALPIGCGQTSPPPSVLAAMVAALELTPADRVCEIGTGTGYCTALLAQLAKEVVSLERFQTLALEASARLSAFGLMNVTVQWRNGYDLHELGDRFDKVIVHGLIEAPPQEFLKLIARRRRSRLGFRRSGTEPAADCPSRRPDGRTGRHLPKSGRRGRSGPSSAGSRARFDAGTHAAKCSDPPQKEFILNLPLTRLAHIRHVSGGVKSWVRTNE